MESQNRIIGARVGSKLMLYDGDKQVDMLISDPTSYSYIPEPRFDHCSSIAGKNLYIHRGIGCSSSGSVVEEYDPHSERWNRRSTTGDIPEAKSGIACAHRENKLYTFGGEIKPKLCSNVLSELDTTTMIWKTLSPIDSQGANLRPKKDTAMISYKDYLVIFGGLVILPGSSKRMKFLRGSGTEVWTNEVTLFDVKRSKLNYFEALQKLSNRFHDSYVLLLILL